MKMDGERRVEEEKISFITCMDSPIQLPVLVSSFLSRVGFQMLRVWGYLMLIWKRWMVFCVFSFGRMGDRGGIWKGLRRENARIVPRCEREKSTWSYTLSTRLQHYVIRIKQILGLAVLLVNYALGNLDCGLCNVPTRSRSRRMCSCCKC